MSLIPCVVTHFLQLHGSNYFQIIFFCQKLPQWTNSTMVSAQHIPQQRFIGKFLWSGCNWYWNPHIKISLNRLFLWYSNQVNGYSIKIVYNMLAYKLKLINVWEHTFMFFSIRHNYSVYPGWHKNCGDGSWKFSGGFYTTKWKNIWPEWTV